MGSPYENEEKAVRDAVLNLFGVSGAHNFIIPIPGTKPPLFIAAGEALDILKLTGEKIEGGEHAG
jgi:hypothetical protein